MTLLELEKKEILILGLGKEGLDTFFFLRKKFPQKKLGLADQLELNQLPKSAQAFLKKDKNLKTHLGDNYLKALGDYEIIFKSPGVPLKKIEKCLGKKQELTSQTKFFLENCPAKIIGVTGTKGKGTTASLIYQIIKYAGSNAYLVGNIGQPVLSYLEGAKQNDIFVYELSSHQLQGVKTSPEVAVFLNLYQAHLDHFKSIKDYQKAKENIALYQAKKDFFIYNKDDAFVEKLSKKTKAKKISFSLKKRADCFLSDGWLLFGSEKIIKASEVPLAGRFNLYNVMAAVCAARVFEMTPKVIARAIKEFRPLPHRLEFVGEFKKIKFFNDSLATLPEPVIFTIDAFGRKLETIILGGYDAKQDFRGLARAVLSSQIKTLILFPPAGKRIHQEIKNAAKSKKIWQERLGQMEFLFTKKMQEAVELAYQKTNKNKICLLSPACPSFGIFKDYKDRGEQFVKYIKKYGR